MPKASNLNDENRKYMKESIVNEYIRNNEEENLDWMDNISDRFKMRKKRDSMINQDQGPDDLPQVSPMEDMIILK